MATVTFQNSTRAGDKVRVIAEVGGGLKHMMTIPATSVAARAEKEGKTEDEALLAFLNDPFTGHKVTAPTQEFMTVLKGNLNDALQVHQGSVGSGSGSGSGDSGVQRSEQRRNSFIAGMADNPRPVPASRRRRVVARKQTRHG